MLNVWSYSIECATQKNHSTCNNFKCKQHTGATRLLPGASEHPQRTINSLLLTLSQFQYWNNWWGYTTSRSEIVLKNGGQEKKNTRLCSKPLPGPGSSKLKATNACASWMRGNVEWNWPSEEALSGLNLIWRCERTWGVHDVCIER